MVSKEFIQTLRILSQELKDINWVLVGSMSLALQGVDIKPGDIDVLIKKEDVNIVNEKLKEYEIKPIEYSSSKIFRSYLGEFKINNIKVEIMADLEEDFKGKWFSYKHRLNNPSTVKINKLELPISLLSEQLEKYRESGRKAL